MLAGGGVVALTASVFFSPETIEDGPVLCPFRLLTGLPCPGCGLTRSWVYATHGWWRESFLAHPFGLLSIAVVLTLAVLVVRARVTGRSGPDVDRWVRHPLVITIAASWLVFAVVRAVLAA
ncbi:DUF2752 domain-containing protein [Nocardioides sp. BGMRC 2183]|nr:DUF2752 domain-containing protein [Nocardioides sp. BGMRC 2183]